MIVRVSFPELKLFAIGLKLEIELSSVDVLASEVKRIEDRGIFKANLTQTSV